MKHKVVSSAPEVVTPASCTDKFLYAAKWGGNLYVLRKLELKRYRFENIETLGCYLEPASETPSSAIESALGLDAEVYRFDKRKELIEFLYDNRGAK